MKKRFVYRDIKEDILNEDDRRIIILKGLRRTGKTVLLNQLAEEFSSNVLVLDNYSSLKDIYSHIEISGNKYIFIDEISLLSGIHEKIYDIYNRFSKDFKIVVTGTDSLSFTESYENSFMERVKISKINPISVIEFNYLFSLENSNESFDKYIDFGGLFDSEGDVVKFTVDNIRDSIMKNNYKVKFLDIEDLDEINFYIFITLFKVFLDEKELSRSVLLIEGINKKSKEMEYILNELFFDYVNFIHNATGLRRNIERNKFIEMVKILKDVGLLYERSPLIEESEYKLMISVFKVKRFLYSIIRDIVELKYPDKYRNFSITHYGLIFENIMNLNVNYLNKDYKLKSLNLSEISMGEVDEVVEKEDKIILIDYKRSELFNWKENLIFNDKELLRMLESRTGKKIETLYVYKGETLSEKVVNYYDFLNNFVEGQASLISTFNWE